MGNIEKEMHNLRKDNDIFDNTECFKHNHSERFLVPVVPKSKEESVFIGSIFRIQIQSFSLSVRFNAVSHQGY